jgi:hypothetical protein
VQPSSFLRAFLLWVAVIAVSAGPLESWNWVKRFMSTVFFCNSGANPEARIPIGQRFSAPQLEWNHTQPKFRHRILFFFILPQVLVIGAYLFRIIRLRFDQKNAVVLGMGLSLWFYYAWYFLLSPTMWLRHIQPGIYVSIAMMVFLVLEIVATLKQRGKAKLITVLFAGMLLMFAGIEVVKIRQGPAGPASATVLCQEVRGPQCGTL